MKEERVPGSTDKNLEGRRVTTPRQDMRGFFRETCINQRSNHNQDPDTTH